MIGARQPGDDDETRAARLEAVMHAIAASRRHDKPTAQDRHDAPFFVGELVARGWELRRCGGG